MTSQEFKAIREQIGLTPTELGRLMAMTYHEIHRIENGVRQPTAKHAAFIRYIEGHPPKRGNG